MQPTGGVEHVDVIAAQGRLLLGALRDLDCILARHDRQGVDADLAAQDRQLLHRGRAVGVQGRHQHALLLAVLQALGELCRGGGLARALQPDHQDRRRRAVDAQRVGRALALQDLDQLVMDDLDDLLARRHRFRDGCAGGLGGDRLHEAARHGQGHVGLQQGHAHLAHGGGDVVLGQRALLGQPVEDASKAVGQVFKHRRPSSGLPFAPEAGRDKQRRPRGRNALTGGDPRPSQGPEGQTFRESGDA